MEKRLARELERDALYKQRRLLKSHIILRKSSELEKKRKLEEILILDEVAVTTKRFRSQKVLSRRYERKIG